MSKIMIIRLQKKVKILRELRQLPEDNSSTSEETKKRFKRNILY